MVSLSSTIAAAILLLFCPPPPIQPSAVGMAARHYPHMDRSEAADDLASRVRCYQRMALMGGWPSIGELMDGDELAYGDSDPRVPILRARLASCCEAYGEGLASASEVYDEEVARAVWSFQKSHGLPADGRLDAATARELSVPVESRLRVMLINLERLRWLSSIDRGGRHIWVNIPSFEVGLYQGRERVDTVRAIVGKPRRPTPRLSGLIRQMEVNPYWIVPRGIILARILPRALRNPGWFARSGYQVLRGGARVSPSSVSWDRVRRGIIDFTLRQPPGPRNAMGRVKFMFSNSHGVYLHDTPDKHYFRHRRRTFSFGCVRVEEPQRVARFLMRGFSEEETSEVLAMISGDGSSRTRRIELSSPVPVHIVYLTAWVDEEGRLNFRDDVYGKDQAAARHLDETCPGWDRPRERPRRRREPGAPPLQSAAPAIGAAAAGAAPAATSAPACP
ncbi:MAG: L,D-transpeptidase family protein [Myxococcota bacterium]